jgi:hypothetical protein
MQTTLGRQRQATLHGMRAGHHRQRTEKGGCVTQAVQISMKKADGTIYVVGGDDFDTFYGNLVSLSAGETTLADDVLADMVRCLSPMAAAVNTVQASMPGAAVAGYYTPGGQPQPQQANGAGVPRISTQPIGVTIPWPD